MALISWPSTRPSADGPDSGSSAATEGIDAFVSESALTVATVAAPPARAALPTVQAPARRRGTVTAFKWFAVVLASAGAAAAGMWAYQQRPVQPLPASLTLQTTPSGMDVVIGGKPMGVTPLTVSLDAGQYPVGLSASDGRRRDFAVTLTAGGSVVQHVEMGAAPALAASVGALLVTTEPSRQMVIVDDVQRGFSPITVADLPPGEHVVQVRTPTGVVRRTIPVEAGRTVSLVVSAPVAAGVKAGWVQISSPVVLELRENGTVIGTTASERLMLPAGEHEIELRNDALGFRATRQVSVAADRTVALPITMPNGTVSINALPWAEVWLGGQRIGETPIANLSWPLGAHQVLLRHPQLGERRATVTISARETARLGVDMRTP